MSNMIRELVIDPEKGSGCDEKSVCTHHWIIETPNGSSSRGVCKFCQEEREFHNSSERYLLKKRSYSDWRSRRQVRASAAHSG